MLAQVNPILPSAPVPSMHVLYPSANLPILDSKTQQQQQFAEINWEVAQFEKLRTQTSCNIPQDINSTSNIRYTLPFNGSDGANIYKEAYNKLRNMNAGNYCVADVIFDIENAYFDNRQDKREFTLYIEKAAQFLTDKMNELDYDPESNVAKNLLLFQFFAEPLQLKAAKQKHLPFKYDFDDYMGVKDYSKMFVTKLMATGAGQCHSLPLLYLILAEKIGAEAYLAFSPNHSYIKFPDEKKKWYNIELTNGMFTTPAFILNSGYIKAEALQSQIYMKSLNKRELLSQFYVDLAGGYVHKFGYDDFAKQIIDSALELYPDNINAQMMKATYYNRLFEFVASQLGINPFDKADLQRIKGNPRAVAILAEVNKQYQTIDELGYEKMPFEAYEEWLKSVTDEKNKQENEKFKQQFKGSITRSVRN